VIHLSAFEKGLEVSLV